LHDLKKMKDWVGSGSLRLPMDEQYSQETTNDPPLWPILFLSTVASRCLDSMGAHKVLAADKPECIASIKETRAQARARLSRLR
jgi:hypothetical protein